MRNRTLADFVLATQVTASKRRPGDVAWHVKARLSGFSSMFPSFPHDLSPHSFLNDYVYGSTLDLGELSRRLHDHP